MSRITPLSFRINPEMKEALEKAANDDSRSVSSLVIKILSDWLVSKGYLGK